ncbi:MAG: hypothetical protein JNN30_02395 [Rhodanobacteraceae bacterium]|nr:hypothetical protein [Rhodanobacteraceae bacterium]
MSHHPTATDLNPDPLAGALRQLPPATPPAEGWQVLAASLRAQGLVRDHGAEPTTAEATPHKALRRAAHSFAQPRSTPRRTGLRRTWLAYGISAMLAVCAAVLLPTNQTENSQTTTAPGISSAHSSAGPDTTAADELTALRNESSRTEEWLRLLKADETPLDGRSLMAATELEDMIGLVDLQLTAGDDAGNDMQALWRKRVELLRDLATVRTTYSLAGTGIAANGTAAAPDNWTHL